VRKTFFLLLPAIAALGAWAGYSYWKFRVAPGILFSELRVISQKNEERSLPGPTIVVFGQSWCHDCHRELPRLHKLWRKNFPQMAVVVISDEDLETLQKWQKQMNIPFPYYRIRGSFEDLGIHSYPTTYILDKKLKVLYSKVGNVDWESSQVKTAFATQN